MVGVISLPDLLEVVGREGPCCRQTRRRRPRSWMEEFLFVETIEVKKYEGLGPVVVSAITSAGIAAIAAGSMGSSAAVAACVPIIVPMSNALIDAGIPIGDEAKNSMSTLMTVNSLQLSFGLIEFLTGDIVNGFTHMIMAGVGFYVVKLDGIVLLPSYSVATSIFAGVSALNAIEMLLFKGTVSGDLPLTDNLLKFATIAHPVLYAASAFIAWNLIDQLRNGLLTNQGAAPAAQPQVVLEPLVPAQQRGPFVGRAFRLDAQAQNSNQ